MKKKARPLRERKSSTRRKPSKESEVDLLSTLSHEVRTPLTSISGYVKLLLAGDVGSLNEVQRDYLSIVDRNVDRLTQLINEILDCEVIESGKIPMSKSILDLGPILQECCQTFGVLASKKGLKLESQISENLRPVFGDRSRLVQVFMNLISNAIKFTQTGSVKVLATDTRLGVSVVVEDTGIGLSESEKKKVFKKFFRTPSALTSPNEGTGLGLTITRGLVKSHGGKVTVKSQKGKGTQFTVTLPAVYRKNSPGEALEA